MKFHVMREHLGDRMYVRGDTREANEADVKHLLDKGVLSKDAPGKAEPAPKNKADKAPKNKADKAPKNKADKAPKNTAVASVQSVAASAGGDDATDANGSVDATTELTGQGVPAADPAKASE